MWRGISYPARMQDRPADGSGSRRLDLVRRHLDADPSCIRMNVTEEWFPKNDPRAGGTIYLWELRANRTAHTVARYFGNEDVFQFLMGRTPQDLKLALAVELGDDSTFRAYLSCNPDAAKTLSDADCRTLPEPAESNNTKAVQLMLQAGWPVNTPGNTGATALHSAGFNGNAKMARAILRFQPDLELKSREYEGTHCSGLFLDQEMVGTAKQEISSAPFVPFSKLGQSFRKTRKREPSDAFLEVLP